MRNVVRMKLTIIHYTILVLVFVVLFVVKARKTQTESDRQTSQSPRGRQTPAAIDSTPDDPTPFGYKCMWFAVKTTNAEEVVKALGLKSSQRCNWKSGIAAAYEESVFVAPPINGWTLVVGRSLPTPEDDSRRKETDALLEKLSQKFGEAQHFGTHRVSDYHAWARAIEGKITREYAYVAGEDLLCNIGKLTDEERAVGAFDSPEFFTNESHVMQVAGKWSLDPTKLSSTTGEKGVGWLGTL